MVALMPVTLMAPLLPPLKEPEIVGLGEVLVDDPDPLEGGVEDLLMEELGLKVAREGTAGIAHKVGEVKFREQLGQHIHGRRKGASSGGGRGGQGGAGRDAFGNFECGGLGKRGGDVSYRRGLEGVSRASRGVNAKFRWTGNTARLDSPRRDDRKNHSYGSICGRDDVSQRKSIAEVIVGQVCRGRVSLYIWSLVVTGTAAD